MSSSIDNCCIKCTLKNRNINTNAKTLDRRPCTGRSQEAVVIFLFGLEALLRRDSRVLSYAASSSPKLWAAIGYYSDQTQFLLAPTVIRPVSNSLLSICGPLENTALLKCRHPHCVALSFYIMSLTQTGYGSICLGQHTFLKIHMSDIRYQ